MKMLKSLLFSAFLVFIVSLANGHTLITSVNGGIAGLRKTTTTSPVRGNYQSKDMLCGINPKPSSGILRLKAGDSINLNYFNKDLNQVIPESHVGPCMAYIAEARKPNKFSKIFEHGLKANGESCISGLDKNGNYYKFGLSKTGKLSFRLPFNLKSGKYIVRTELLALHVAYKVGRAEFYPQCIDIEVTGPSNGVGVGTNAVSIPGHVNARTPGVLFHIFKGKNASYTIPGPKIDPSFKF